ncbi:MAG: hypothetical protein WA865_00080 [Spirulinaceae cyanobacterium]
MDKLQEQIVDMDRKVEKLYQTVERLGTHITAVLLEQQQDNESVKQQLADISQTREYAKTASSNLDSVMEHKDVLVDSRNWGNNSENSGNKQLSCDIQLQRVTAQLTAAYNRIAALEEQLLAGRSRIRS